MLREPISQIVERACEPNAEWTYFNLIALALAEATQSKYHAEPVEWSRAVLAAAEADPDQLAALGIYFDRRYPDRPYSEQVASALVMLERLGVVEPLRVQGNGFVYSIDDTIRHEWHEQCMSIYDTDGGARHELVLKLAATLDALLAVGAEDKTDECGGERPSDSPEDSGRGQ